MRRIALSESPLENFVGEAARVLMEGGVILFPTDTLYGLGADAFSDAAVDKIYAIKGRDEKKPIHCIVAGMAMAEEYAQVGNDARLLLQRFLPGALTIILKKKSHVRNGIARGIDTVGIRIPQNDFCVALAKAFGRPYTATSANLSGAAPRFSVQEILEQLGAGAAGIDVCVDAGRLPPSAPSTVVDLSGEEPVILREGAIPAADIWETIRIEE